MASSPHVQVLHDQFVDDPDIKVLAVHVDDKRDPPGYLKEKGYTFKSVRNDALVEQANVEFLPTFLVLGPDGEVLHRRVGALDEAAAEKLARIAREAAKG